MDENVVRARCERGSAYKQKQMGEEALSEFEVIRNAGEKAERVTVATNCYRAKKGDTRPALTTRFT
jgi:hypothetical protein